jgi:signal transduction histidine kinase
LAQAADLDAARAEAVAQAEGLATELERHRQHRIIHDSALQVLEAVAGGWDVDEDLLQRRITYETARLRRLLDATVHSAQPLAEQLSALVEVFAVAGLQVDLDTTALGRDVSPETADALAEATHEALTNVHKHAGVSVAAVRAAAETTGTEVRIIDQGRGFDPRLPRQGFGLSESIEGRLRDVEGRASVSSSPGQGTDVHLWVPR